MLYINSELLKTKNFEDRYDPQKFIPYDEYVYDISESWFYQRILRLPIKGEYVVHGEESRPELISYNVYGTTSLWHILMAYNRITDFTEVSVGKVIYYPSIEDIEQIYFSLNSKQRIHPKGIISKV